MNHIGYTKYHGWLSTCQKCGHTQPIQAIYDLRGDVEAMFVPDCPSEKCNKVRTKYVLVHDDDGHWYVIPADKQMEFLEITAFWEDPQPEIPDWAVRVHGSPYRVHFESYSIG